MPIIEVPLDHALPHPLNSHIVTQRERRNIANNIRRTGKYPPLTVRELDDKSEYYPGEPGYYQILDGHQRHDIFEELVEEGREEFATIRVDDWSPLTDEEALIALATLNSWGANVPRKRAELLHAITKFTDLTDAADILPETARQIQDAQKLLKRPVADIKRLIEKAEQPDVVTMSFVIGDGSQKAALARFTAAAQLFAVFYGAEFLSAEIQNGSDRGRVAVMTFQVQNAAKTVVEEALKRAGAGLPPGTRNKRGRSLEELATAYLATLAEEDQVPLVQIEAERKEPAPAPKKRRTKTKPVTEQAS